MQSLKAERHVEISKTNVENKNPHPCAECGIGNDHRRLQHRLRAARMGVGSFLRAGLACGMESLLCLHSPNATGSLNCKPSQTPQKSTTTASQIFSHWSSQDRLEHSHASNTGVSFGNVYLIADSAARKSVSTKTGHSTTYSHKVKVVAISSGISFSAVSSATGLKRTAQQSNGRLTFLMVLNQLFISRNRLVFIDSS